MSTDKILVIGGYGLIGSRVAAKLSERGHEVTLFDNFEQFSDPREFDYYHALGFRKAQLARYRCATIRGDATQATDLLAAFESTHPDRVILLAAVPLAQVSDAQVSKAVEYTTVPISHILQIGEHFALKRFVYVSSSFVYGDFQRTPCDEEHPCQPRTVYGAAKLAGEWLTRVIAERFAIPYAIVRPISVFGPGDVNGHLSARNLQRALETGVFPVTSLDSMTDWTYVDDTAEGMVRALLLDAAIGETFNISRGRGRTFADIIRILNDLGHPVRAGKIRGQTMKNQPQRSALSIEKARVLLDYVPTVDLEDGLVACLQYVRDRSTEKGASV